ncbi:hypothetical protein BpHYR1_022319 [Brachionus plicatilis]|uniref:Uncharacterized protein n=1 Tax=Brachionus plicatilis TaxID=10195 RepID=A0A3M7S4W8_BRAPC|nr:hypothetical protein BpHYR1_022319 [Brachionus plicatilis]
MTKIYILLGCLIHIFKSRNGFDLRKKFQSNIQNMNLYWDNLKIVQNRRLEKIPTQFCPTKNLIDKKILFIKILIT